MMQDNIQLSDTYGRTIGKVTFRVSAFCNPKGTETAQQLMVHLLERSAVDYKSYEDAKLEVDA